MGAPNLTPVPADGDWAAVRKAIGILSTRLGPGGAPHFAALDTDVLTSDSLTLTGLSGVLQATDGVVSGSAAHSALATIGANDHHNKAHVLDGADHTVSGLTPGHVLKALTGTTFGFAAPTDVGFANPMTTYGDMIAGDLDGLPVPLEVGDEGDVLTVASGYPTWAAGPVFTTGFENRTASTLTLSTRTLTVGVVSGSFNIYSAGKRINKTGGATCATTIASSVGLYYVYFDSSGVLQNSTDEWDIEGSDVPVCTIYWNGTAGAISEERHSAKRNQQFHRWAHDTVGCRYGTGLDLTSPSTTVDGKCEIMEGVIQDEDIELTISTAKGKLVRHYYETAAGVWTWANGADNSGNDYPYIRNSGTGKVRYPKSDSGYALTDAADNKYVIVWVYATTDKDRPIQLITQAKTAPYNTAVEARAALPPTIRGVLAPEKKLICRWIFSGDGQFDSSQDYRTSSTLPSGGTSSVIAGSVRSSATSTLLATNVQTALEELDSGINALETKRIREIINTLLGVFITLDHTAGGYQGLYAGVLDAMESNAGADATANLSATYDSGNDWWTASGDTAAISQTTATSYRVVGDIGGVETRQAQTFTPTATAQVPAAAIYISAKTGTPTGDITARLETTAAGVPTGTLICAGATATATPAIAGWTIFNFNISTLNLGVPVVNGTMYALVLVCGVQADNQYWRWGSVTPSGYASGTSCASVDGGATWATDSNYDMAFKIYTGGNMRLQSIAFTAQAQPSLIRLILLETDDTIVLNTDLTAQVSRDGGTTWTAATLVSKGVVGPAGAGGPTLLYAATSVAAQPAGTSIKWRLETYDDHVIRIRCAGIVWE